jgi:DNA-binding protein H-NS
MHPSLSTMPAQPPSNSADGLALAELQRQLAEVDAAIAERRVEELKVLADGFARKLAVNGFSVKEGIAALKPYVGKNLLPQRPASGTGR